MSNYKDLKKKHKSCYSPKMGGTEKGAVGARGLLVCHSSPLTGLPHVTSSELPFFPVEKSESPVLSVLRVARKERKCSGGRLSKLTLRH